MRRWDLFSFESLQSLNAFIVLCLHAEQVLKVMPLTFIPRQLYLYAVLSWLFSTDRSPMGRHVFYRRLQSTHITAGRLKSLQVLEIAWTGGMIIEPDPLAPKQAFALILVWIRGSSSLRRKPQPFSHKQSILLICNKAGELWPAWKERRQGRIEVVSCGVSPGTSLKIKFLVDEWGTDTNLNFHLQEPKSVRISAVSGD